MVFEGKADQVAIWEGMKIERYASLDPAFTTDGDRCVLRFAKAGNLIDGKPALELTEKIEIKLVESVEYPLNYQIADRVILECRKRYVEPQDFCMDSTSASGLADIIAQRWSNAIIRVNFGGNATDTAISMEDPRPAKEVYKNRVTQLWMAVNRIVSGGRLRGLDSDTAKEFCSRQYKLVGEKMVVETKKEMKLRTGGVSPDLADPAALLVDHFLKRFGLSSISTSNSNEQASWKRVIAKCKLRPSYK
jgi:hypothetical protein